MKAPLRKRRSKGTIAGYAFRSAGAAAADASELSENLSGSQGHHPSISGAASQPQHPTAVSTAPPKPCHSARLALLCAQNAIRMGARTQLNLCPPGRARRELQSKLRQRTRAQKSASRRSLPGDSSGYYSLEHMIGAQLLDDYDGREEDAILSGASAFEDQMDEDASSGDEDSVRDLDEFFSEDLTPLDEDEHYENMPEPLFTPAGSESALSNPNGAPVASIGSSASGKLPFNRRKLLFFDSISAAETGVVRSYLGTEARRSRRRSTLLLTKHLQRMQREDNKRKRMARGESVDEEDDVESPDDKSLLEGGVTQFRAPMTAPFAAALLIESLCTNKVESVEGMAKCYDGIVAAGVALLDTMTIDPTTPSSAQDKAKPTRSKIMAALAPLLITSLEQPSGELILALAKLRRMCGTMRYQRRFVQRVAPYLIRPPQGAIWCLRHQNDMEAILAAAELIFDAAFDVFGKGWYERGQLLLADSKRAETLNSAADQLRMLSSEPADGLALGLSSHPRRRHLAAVKKKKDGKNAAGESLAEWEVIAVDRQIRVAISNALSTDWNRATIQMEGAKLLYRRAGSSLSSTKRPANLPQSASTESSPKTVPSPRSPARPFTSVATKAPHSPPHMPSAATLGLSSSDTMENIFGPSFASSVPGTERATTPPPTELPVLPRKQEAKEQENEQRTDSTSEIAQSTLAASSTPPRSPRSPKKTEIDSFKFTETSASTLALSPSRKQSSKEDRAAGQVTPTTPLSPSSIGTSGSLEIVSYRPSATTPSISSSGTATAAHYRTLTSTAAERKRTVAACRALRAQIQRFEDAFVQLHGRPPRGASDRAPLATTYAQYRDWKRAIRADAACRIQALFRGARARWALLRSNDKKLTRIVMRRAGRRGYTPPNLSIPVEIGQPDHDRRGSSTSTSPGTPESRSSQSANQPLAPQWASRFVRPRTNSGDRLSSPDSFPSGQSPPSSFSVPPTASRSSDAGKASLAELQSRKRDLKQQLKQYDMNFARQHGRMPVKAEKEPIRHLYESYNALKSQISQLEENRSMPTAVQTTTVPPVARATSPPSGSESAGSDEPPARAASVPTRSRRQVPRSGSSPPMSGSTPSGALSQDLTTLKAEKQTLHQMLRSYEKDFFREHNRQVSSFSDIRPVASQYRRYKEIKKAIAALQQQG